MLNLAYSYYLKSLSLLDNISGIGPLLLRIYLAPIFIIAGWGKLDHFDGTVSYFGEYLGLPMPEVMAALAGSAEFVGGWMLLFGVGIRFAVIPLMFTMIIAAVTAHWENGWHALPETQLQVPWEWREDLIEEANDRKAFIKKALKDEGYSMEYLQAAGPITILKNGIEFAATYFVMLLVLLFTGGGRFVSMDYYVKRYLDNKLAHS